MLSGVMGLIVLQESMLDCGVGGSRAKVEEDCVTTKGGLAVVAVVGVMREVLTPPPFVLEDNKEGNANFEGAWILMLLGCLRLIFFRVKSWWVDGRIGGLGLEGREVTEAYGEEEGVIDVVGKNEVTAGVVAPGVDGALSMEGSVTGVSTCVGDAICVAKEK